MKNLYLGEIQKYDPPKKKNNSEWWVKRTIKTNRTKITKKKNEIKRLDKEYKEVEKDYQSNVLFFEKMKKAGRFNENDRESFFKYRNEDLNAAEKKLRYAKEHLVRLLDFEELLKIRFKKILKLKSNDRRSRNTKRA